MEGCPVTAACLETLAALHVLLYLNLSRCNLTDDGCEKFSGLTNLESLNMDSCRIDDEGLVNLTACPNWYPAESSFLLVLALSSYLYDPPRSGPWSINFWCGRSYSYPFRSDKLCCGCCGCGLPKFRFKILCMSMLLFVCCCTKQVE